MLVPEEIGYLLQCPSSHSTTSRYLRTLTQFETNAKCQIGSTVLLRHPSGSAHATNNFSCSSYPLQHQLCAELHCMPCLARRSCPVTLVGKAVSRRSCPVTLAGRLCQAAHIQLIDLQARRGTIKCERSGSCNDSTPAFTQRCDSLCGSGGTNPYHSRTCWKAGIPTSWL